MFKTIAKLEFAIFIASTCLISAGILGFYVKIFAGAPPLPIEVINMPILLSMLAVVVLRLRESVFGLISVMPYFLLMVLALASFKWSLQPAFTFKEAFVSLIYVVYLGTMCWRYSWKELIEGMWIAMFGMAVVSILLFVLMPSIGKMGAPHPGALSGIWMEKNATGQAATFGALIALARFALSPKTFFTSMVSFLVFTAMLLLSTSKTSLVAYIVGCGGFGWVFMMRRNLPVFMATTWISLVGGGLLVNFIRHNTDMVLGLLGRSSTFTGRSEIWQSVKISLADRPLLGHGYSGYWDLEIYGKTLTYVWDDLQYLPRHSHNSLIEMQLNLGVVGAAIMVMSIAIYLVISLLRVRNNNGAYFVLPFTFAALIIGSFESVLAYPNNFAGGMLILVAGKMIRPALRSEARSSLWAAIRGSGERAKARRQAEQNSRPPYGASYGPAGAPYMPPPPMPDRRAAPQPAGFAPLPVFETSPPPLPYEARRFTPPPRKTPRRTFGRKPKGLKPVPD